MEDNWRKKKSTIASTRTINVDSEVSELKLLPGGKYLAASLKCDRGFFITLDHLDHPNGVHRVAVKSIPAEATRLEAKYMTYQGKPMIMVAYVAREIFRPKQANNNPGQVAETPPRKVHMLRCIYVDLGELDTLAAAPQNSAGLEMLRRRIPFKGAVVVPLKSLPVQVSLYSQAGIAHVSAVQEAVTADTQDYLVIINLEHPREPCILVCQPHQYERVPSVPVQPLPDMKQWIRAVRHLPEQNNVLIWRTIRTNSSANNEQYAHGIELVNMPERTEERKIILSVPILGHIILGDGTVDSVQITDDAWPYDGKKDVPLQASSQPPPPISIFAEMSSPGGIRHWHVWPKPGLTRESPPYAYYPYPETLVKQTMYDAYPDTAHVLPGIFRSLVYTTRKSEQADASQSLVALRRYISPEYQSLPYTKLVQRVERHSTVERKKYKHMPVCVYSTINTSPDFLLPYRSEGLGAITWDHTIGRLCMAPARGGVIQLIDFSHAKAPDDRFLFWKMLAPGGFEHTDDDQEYIPPNIGLEIEDVIPIRSS
ncbi:hypothetical protein C0992_003793 [Termitomyces sp. T32_za158]|nr:hypothetical protein C0992_003793 [Termitomyces sp. T32_za158]